MFRPNWFQEFQPERMEEHVGKAGQAAGRWWAGGHDGRWYENAAPHAGSSEACPAKTPTHHYMLSSPMAGVRPTPLSIPWTATAPRAATSSTRRSIGADSHVGPMGCSRVGTRVERGKEERALVRAGEGTPEESQLPSTSAHVVVRRIPSYSYESCWPYWPTR